MQTTSSDPFSASLAAGPHARLSTFVGEWEGSTKTWFRPGELADESDWAGSICPVLDGRFVVHEYRGSLAGEALEGRATLGFDVGGNRFVCAWVDSFHTGTGVMLSEGEPGVSDVVSVLGAYDAGDGVQWGWRSTFELGSSDELVVSHANIPFGVPEYLAVETRYRRRPDREELPVPSGIR